MSNKFYITTPIYYVNAKPHIGHAYTSIAADVLARFHKLLDEEVFLLTGTDEHGLKIQKKAEEAGKDPQVFVDEISQEFKSLWEKLDVKYDNFIRTTDESHKKAVQKVLQFLYDKKAIYKGEYEGLYCVGCEQFKSENDLIDGKCPDHGIVPEKIKEECYLMKMSGETQKNLIENIKNNNFKIAPEKYKKEILSFLESQELKDVSISRKNVKWGISLPFDPEHTTYVWIDALLNYLTGIGWDGDLEKIPDKWPSDVQIIGKDILRIHATIWPVLLMHLGIPFPKLLFTHGHLLAQGKKMSKTLGNSISIDEMLEKFGKDATRYLLLSAGTFGDDVDVTMERIAEKYNADLANGLGNLVSRVIKLANNYDLPITREWCITDKISKDDFNNLIIQINFGEYLGFIMDYVRRANKFIEDEKPWELAKNNQEGFNNAMRHLLNTLSSIPETLSFFMPETSEKIKKALETKKLDGVLFQRIK